jgi:transposase
MVLKVRESLIEQRTATANTLRGHAAEFGVVSGKGLDKIASLLSAIEPEEIIPPEAREMFVVLGEQIEEISGRIKQIDARLNDGNRCESSTYATRW